MKEREPRYSEIRRRLEQGRPRRLTPAAAAIQAAVPDSWVDEDPVAEADLAPEVEFGSTPTASAAPGDGSIPLRKDVPPRSGNRPPPRPRKKGRRR